MKIVVVNGATDLYGANRILSFALNAFPEESRIKLLLPHLNGPLINHLREKNPRVEIIQCDSIPIIQRSMFSIGGSIQVIKLLKKFHSFLKQENRNGQIDLIYVNTLSNFFVLPVARILTIRTLIHVHEILDTPKRVSGIINKFAVKWSSSILAVSNAVKQNLLKSTNGEGNHKISVIHNGIPDLYDPQISLNKKFTKCVITLIGRIKPEKGIWYFLDALSLLKNQQDLCVKIIGGAAPFGESYVEQLKKDILKLGIEIEYIPFTADVRSFLNETDILVVPSTGKESFPTTVLEGMSAGKPVIATNTGGAAEAIVHEESGFLINNDNPENFALILAQLIEDEHLREKVGIRARERYLSYFSLKIFNSNMQKFLIKELKGNT